MPRAAMKRATLDGGHGKNDFTGGIINSCIKTAKTEQFGGLMQSKSWYLFIMNSLYTTKPTSITFYIYAHCIKDESDLMPGYATERLITSLSYHHFLHDRLVEFQWHFSFWFALVKSLQISLQQWHFYSLILSIPFLFFLALKRKPALTCPLQKLRIKWMH